MPDSSQIPNATTYLVGGAVRDKLLGYPFQERDWVVVGANPQAMLDQGFRPVGADFPVFIHPQTGEEYALARTERKSGHGYTGFTFYAAPDVSLEQDLARRDLTINAMAESPDGQLIDPFGGQADLENKILRHVSGAFSEDPLRVLRVARFAARYRKLGFSVAPETVELMREIADSGELRHLTAERTWKETDRALGEDAPDVYVQVLRDCGALAELFPEVERLFGVPQRADYHPEVDTGIHILMSLQQAARLTDSRRIRFAVLVHDLGKGTTPDNILPRHIGHEARGVALVSAVCDRLRVPNDYRQLALAVTEHHLLCHQAKQLKPATVLKLLKNIGGLRSAQRVSDFVTSCEADARGRTGFEDRDYPSSDFLRAAREAASAVETDDLANSGLEGEAIGHKVKERQIAAIAALKDTCGT